MAKDQLQIILEEQNVAQENAQALIKAFGAPFVEAGEILATYKEIVVTEVDDFQGMAEARDKRLILKKIRTGVENKRKELKSDIVKQGKAIDSVAKFVRENIEPAEKYLEDQEKFAEIKAAEAAAKLKAERVEKLMKYTDDISLYNLDDMDEDQFAKLLSTLKEAEEAKIAEAKRIEDERIAAELAEKKRQAERDAENAQLKKEAEEKEAEREAERRKAAEEQAKKDAEAQKLIDAERTAAEVERKKREAIEAEQRAKDEKAERERLEAEEKERKQLLAPDKDKLIRFSEALETIRSEKLPAVKTNQAQDIVNQIDAALAELSKKLVIKANEL